MKGDAPREPILHLNTCKKCWERKHKRVMSGTWQVAFRTKAFLINLNWTQLGWGSSVSSGLADSCCYLEPDVMIWGLGKERGIRREKEECDDGLKKIKSDMELKPWIVFFFFYNTTGMSFRNKKKKGDKRLEHGDGRRRWAQQKAQWKHSWRK